MTALAAAIRPVQQVGIAGMLATLTSVTAVSFQALKRQHWAHRVRVGQGGGQS